MRSNNNNKKCINSTKNEITYQHIELTHYTKNYLNLHTKHHNDVRDVCGRNFARVDPNQFWPFTEFRLSHVKFLPADSLPTGEKDAHFIFFSL